MAVVCRDSSRFLRAGSRFRDDAGFTAVEMLTVAAIVALLGAIAAPMFGNMLGNYRLSGDARGVSNSVAVAKMRAASDFTQTRLYVDLGAKTYHIEYWQKTGTPGWITEGGTTYLANQDRFSFASCRRRRPIRSQHRAGGRVHGQRGRGDRQHGLRDLQLARPAGRCHWRRRRRPMRTT